MQSQSLAIEMAGLTKQFGRHRAVDTLNLAVHSGSVFGFLTSKPFSSICLFYCKNRGYQWLSRTPVLVWLPFTLRTYG